MATRIGRKCARLTAGDEVFVDTSKKAIDPRKSFHGKVIRFTGGKVAVRRDRDGVIRIVPCGSVFLRLASTK